MPDYFEFEVELRGRVQKHMRTAAFRTVAAIQAVLLVAFPVLASTQEFEAVVVRGEGENAVVRIERMGYISSYYGRTGNPKTGKEGGVGREITLADQHIGFLEGSRYFIDDAPVKREAFLAAVRPGARLYVRGNRHVPQFFALYSTPAYALEGQVRSVDWARSRATVHTCIDRAWGGGVWEDQMHGFSPDALTKVNGRPAPLREALRTGNHIRVLAPRPQCVVTISPDAHLDADESRQRYAFTGKDGLRTWHHFGSGFLRGFADGRLFAAAAHLQSDAPIPGRYVDHAFKTGNLRKYRHWGFLINGQLVQQGVAFRPGRRAALGNDEMAGGPHGVYRVMAVEDDDGSVEGVVRHVEGGRATLTVTSTATGYAKDVTTRDCTVSFAADARIMLDGRPSTRAAAARAGHFVRLLPALPHGAIFATTPDDFGAPEMGAEEMRVAPRFDRELRAAAAVEHEPVTLRAFATAYPDPTYQWYLNEQPVPGATGPLFRYVPDLGDNGARVTCIAGNGTDKATSNPAVLTVTPDTTPPALEGEFDVFAPDATHLQVQFSEPVEAGGGAGGAENPGNYTLRNAVVKAAAVNEDRRSVLLTVSELPTDRELTLTVRNVHDRAATPNPVAADAARTFRAGDPAVRAGKAHSTVYLVAADGRLMNGMRRVQVGGAIADFSLHAPSGGKQFDPACARSRFKVRLAAGTWKVWLRAKFASGRANSWFVRVEGHGTAMVDGARYGQWHWHGPGSIGLLPEGIHTVTIFAREPGRGPADNQLDMVCLTREGHRPSDAEARAE